MEPDCKAYKLLWQKPEKGRNSGKFFIEMGVRTGGDVLSYSVIEDGYCVIVSNIEYTFLKFSK